MKVIPTALRFVTGLGIAWLGLGVPSDLSAQPAKARIVLRGHTMDVLFVAFSPDGKTLASASFDKTIRLWDAGPDK